MRRLVTLVTWLAFAVPCLAQTSPAPDPYEQGRAIIADINRVVTPRGVQETFDATLGGARQVVNVRGSDRANPILLFIHGGPAAVEMPIAWAFQRPWEDYFTVVQWDQRGAGRSFLLNDPAALASTLRPERYRDDAIDLIELLQKRYGQRKIFVLGHSWGSIVGMMVAAKRPDLLHAYIGVGQVIDFRENERQGYAWTLAKAQAAGNTEAVRELKALRPYPGPGAFDLTKLETERKWNIRFGGLVAGRDNADFYFRAPRLSPEYTAADRQAWSDGSAFTMKTMFPQLADISFAKLDRIDAPVFMFLGRQDYTTPSLRAATWLDRLRAPRKAVVWFEHSAHLPFIEEPGHMFNALLTRVLPLSKSASTEKTR